MTMARWALLAILFVGGGIRLANAIQAPVEFIERDEFIPAALTLSLDNHPIRVAQHGAVPMYLIRASAVVFGHSLPGYRLGGVIAGTLTILLIYLIAARWWGPPAGLIAAGLLAVERYHATVSARAIDLPYDLLFVTLAMYAFSRFLHATRMAAMDWVAGRWLYAAGAAIAVGFLCKELTAMMVPIIGVSLLVTGRGAWLRRREPWLAVALFLVIISPDLYSNATATPDERKAMFERHQEAVARAGGRLTDPAYVEHGLYMSYRDHLSRFRSIGFNREPFYFYFGDFFDWLGIPHVNEFAEFPYLHLALALLLWAGLVHTLLTKPRDACTLFLVTMFVMVFVPFALIRMGPPRVILPTGADVLWYWVDRSMLAAVLVAGRAGTLLPEQLRLRRTR